MSPRNYKIIIGLLVAALIGLNVIKPMIDKRAEERFAVSVMSLIDAVQGKDEATQQAYISQFKAQHRSLALSASADETCGFWTTTRNQFLTAWANFGPRQRVNTMGYYNFLEDMVNIHCADGELEEINPTLN